MTPICVIITLLCNICS